ncbi:nuclear transport factor 2 family protein [Aeromicrobium sp. NPDC092404]|uniref:nuclear transport factor 2 family protein n=1 Tax=Aeromicrobium sp. NPDC092404 TaxID=3154976 RepID=UPI00343A4D9D
MNEQVLQEAFDRYVATVEEISMSRDWSAFADMFTEDATYCEHAYGDFNGREEIRPWIIKTMTAFPGNEMIAFPPAWSILDAPTNRVVCDVRNIMRDPGDGSVHETSNITILTFDDDGGLVRQEDVYNPQKFIDMTLAWCRVADAHGTLSDAGRKMLTALGG